MKFTPSPLAVLSAALLCAGSSRAEPAPPIDYAVVMGGHVSGEMQVTRTGPSTVCTDYSYTDRGRGPKITGCATLDAAGLPTALTVGGMDYLKSPVDERFTRVGGAATWSSAADTGASPAAGFYLAAQSTPQDWAVLAHALLKASNHELDLLPGGHARLEFAADELIEQGGSKQIVDLYLITGPSFDPIPVWLDAGGALLLQGDGQDYTVRKGFEAEAANLAKLQAEVLDKRAFAVARTLQHRPAGPVAIVHAALFDAETRTVRPNTTVIIRGDRIEAVGPDGSIATPAGAEIVDAHGRALLPGLFDMHVHIYSDKDGVLDLINGITTIRDLANDIDSLLERRDRFADGRLVGPRILLGGVIDGKGPLHGPTRMLVATPEEAHWAVETYADRGYDQIKIYSSVPPELVPVIIADAHARGLRVSGHIPAGMTMSEAVTDGYDEVQHANFWVLNFLGPEINARSNGMARFTEVGAKAKDLDLNSPEVRQWVALLQAHKTVVDPTLVAFEVMYLGAPRTIAPSLQPVAARLPPVVARGAAGGQLWKTEAERAAYAASYAQMKRMTKLLYDSGIRIVAGTDGMAGFELAHELETYVSLGIPAPETLYIATLGSARVMKRDKDLGSIAPGKLADLILIDGDPAKTISDVRKVDWVMKGGAIYDPAALARSVGVKPYTKGL